MTSAEFSVSISNAALSGLLYDCCTNESDQIGFLVGKISQTTETVVTDTQEPSTKKQVVYDILSTLPLSTFSFYNAAGEVDELLLTGLTGDLKEQIVGWYISRRNSVNSLCFRESIIDRQLRKALGEYDGKYFIACVVSESKDENNSTIEIQYTFFTRNENNFIPLKVDVDNLAKTDMNFKKSSSVVERFDLFKDLNLVDALKVGMPEFIKHAQIEVASRFHCLSADLIKSEREIIHLKERLKKLQPESYTDCQLAQNSNSPSNRKADEVGNSFQSRSPTSEEQREELEDRSYESETSYRYSQEY